MDARYPPDLFKNQYVGMQAHASTVSMLLSNPVLLFGNADIENLASEKRGAMVDFSMFKARDITTVGDTWGDDVIVILAQSSPIYKAFKKHALLNFKAFYLPYHLNTTIEATVPKEAQIVITYPIAGCSFVAEMGTQSPRIAHINRLDPRGRTDPVKMEEEIARIVAGKEDNFFILRREIDILYSIFGIRQGDHWHYVREEVGENKILNVISTMKPEEYKEWKEEQEKRELLITQRDAIYDSLLPLRIVPRADTVDKSFKFFYKKQFHYIPAEQIPGNIMAQLEMIDAALSGKVKYSAAAKAITGFTSLATSMLKPGAK